MQGFFVHWLHRDQELQDGSDDDDDDDDEGSDLVGAGADPQFI